MSAAEDSPGMEGVHLRLYVAGQAPTSARAVANITEICDRYLDGRYRLEVVDLYQYPSRAQTEQIVVVPTLIKEAPEPRCQIVGDLSDRARVLSVLGIQEDS